jgi:hypothetical protein
LTMRGQASSPLPCGRDDFSVAQAIGIQHHLSSEFPTYLSGAPLPQILPLLLQCATLYVTTDASLQLANAEPLAPGRGGIGIHISNGFQLCQEISWGVSAIAASSTTLEWLGKLAAVWLLRTFAGQVILLCDNAAVQICGFTQWVRTVPWLDRWAKQVLMLPIWSRVQEGWLQAQHDSHLGGCASHWQRRADFLASWGAVHWSSHGIPLCCLLSEMEDPPAVLFRQQAVVFSLKRLVNLLYEENIGHQTLLGTTLLAAGFDSTLWQLVVQSKEISLASHRMAAYLRTIPLLPRLFFAVPSCRFCDHPWGNDYHHVTGCAALYFRLQKGFQAVLRRLVQHFATLPNEVTDLFATFQVQSTTMLVVALPDDQLRAFRGRFGHQPTKFRPCSEQHPAQLLFISWSGLVWLYHTISFSPTYICRALLLELCKDFLSALPLVISDSSSLQGVAGWHVLPMSNLWRLLSPVTVNILLPLPVQGRLVWLLHRLPESRMMQPLALSLYCPPRDRLPPELYSTRVFACPPHECLAVCMHPGRGPVCLLCPCSTIPAVHWHLHRLFPEAALLVSADFTAFPLL